MTGKNRCNPRQICVLRRLIFLQQYTRTKYKTKTLHQRVVSPVRKMKITSAIFSRSAASVDQSIADERPQIAFAGKSNVGKSSLLNTLARVRRLARISSTPGCTRQINFFLINNRFYFVDLPGYGYAKVSKEERLAWRKLVESYLIDNPYLRLLILIHDVRRSPDESQREFIEWLRLHRIPFLIVITKIDKVSRSIAVKQAQAIGEDLGTAASADLVLFSAKTAEGRSEILTRISQAIEKVKN
jgi:GTP-binding protein